MLDPFGDEPQSVPDHEDARRRRHVPADVDMRRGRSPRLATADRVLEFMDFYSRMHGLDRPGDPSIEPGRGRPGDTPRVRAVNDEAPSPGMIKPWLGGAGYEVTNTPFFRMTELPDLESIDLLIVMGGPMSVNDEGEFPWLVSGEAVHL